MSKQVLYLGDTALKEAASYLAGIMSYCHISFDYVASDVPFPNALLENDYRAIIISDYPGRNFTSEQLHLVAKRVSAGTGLLMIGGWESFRGTGGDYHNTILSEVLPVIMQAEDDRVNCPQTCLPEKNCAHAIIAGLPFDKICPTIGGYNRLTSKMESVEVLSSRRFKVSWGDGHFEFVPAEEADPLLVIGQYGQGKAAAFASDVAPHWVGGLVDWGDSRITACASGANPVEVGNWYAQLFCQMIKWTGKL